MNLEDKLRDLLAQTVPEIARLSRAEALAYWQATTSGKKEYEEEYSRCREGLLKFLSNAETFTALKSIRDSGKVVDSLLRRQLEILYNRFLENQIPPAVIAGLVRQETEIESKYTNFRAVYQGRQVSNNDISQALRSEPDSEKRRQAWEASKQIGSQVADKILEVVNLRNDIARNLGFGDYRQMTLTLAEIDPEDLAKTLSELQTLTDEPFRKVKSLIDNELSSRFGVSTLMPWHYSDPFFQEAPALGETDLNPSFTGKNIAELAERYYRGIGFDVTDILDRSDLYERPGKNQHAYCTDLDREGDVRILCNLRSDEYWMGTLLHELGHGVYDKYHDPELPYLLRTHAHTLTSEAVAMLMERCTGNTAWLNEIAGIQLQETDRLKEQLEFHQALGQLIFVRWGLVVVYFERELYANPTQDLDTLWWDLVEELQLVQRPPGRKAPDWAAKIHIATAPVYYQNYILGSLTASQLRTALEREAGAPLPVASPEVGKFLVEKVFKPGSRFPWNEMINRATGEPLSAKSFAAEISKAVGI